VYSFFKASRDIFVLVCVLLILFRYCVVIMCDFLADSLCAIFVYLRFRCVIPLEQVLVWDTLTLKHGQLQIDVTKYSQGVYWVLRWWWHKQITKQSFVWLLDYC
jgi:hypothetical protein